MAEKYSADVRAALAKAKRRIRRAFGFNSTATCSSCSTSSRPTTESAPPRSVQSEINVVPDAMSQPICSLVQYVIGWISEVIKTGRDDGVHGSSPAHRTAKPP